MVENKVSQHKAKDVSVYRSKFMGRDVFSVVIYRKDAGILKKYTAQKEAKENYNKATYSWTNDSTAVIKLSNSQNHRSESFAVTGHGSSTSLVSH